MRSLYGPKNLVQPAERFGHDLVPVCQTTFKTAWRSTLWRAKVPAPRTVAGHGALSEVTEAPVAGCSQLAPNVCGTDRPQFVESA